MFQDKYGIDVDLFDRLGQAFASDLFHDEIINLHEYNEGLFI